VELFHFLSDKENYLVLLDTGSREINRRSHISRDDQQDILAEAMGRILDYFERKPEKLLAVERKSPKEMMNYLKKSIRHQVLNIMLSRHRERIRLLNYSRRCEKERRETIHRQQLSTEPMEDELHWIAMVRDRMNLQDIRKELNRFIQRKCKPRQQDYHREAVAVFIMRLEQQLTISQLQDRYPEKNIASLNTLAHRIFHRYHRWLKHLQNPERLTKGVDSKP